MICPFCRHDDSRVVDSRPAEEGTLIRRRRECTSCGRRFTTSETSVLLIIKRSGATEPFSREKVINGVRKACQGRPINDMISHSWPNASKKLCAPMARPKSKHKKLGWQFWPHCASSMKSLICVMHRSTGTSPHSKISKEKLHYFAPLPQAARL